MEIGLVRIAFVVAAIIYTIGLWIVGLVWMIGVVLPYLFVGGLVLYLIVRGRRHQADLDASLQREAERQRQLNEQELAAWNSVTHGERRKADRRKIALQKFDKRDAPDH